MTIPADQQHRPTLVMIAGPNGSGKSTLTQRLLAQGHDLGDYINPDDIAKTLPGRESEKKSLRAQAIADERRASCLEDRRSFSFETVMSHPSKIDILKYARDLGYEVIVYFIAVDDPATSVQRVADRVRAGGHDVPTERIVARYARTMAALPDAVRAAERTFVFDNSGDKLKSKTKLRPVAELASDGTDITLVRTAARVPGWVEANLLRHALQPTSKAFVKRSRVSRV